jgi:hypothetical protein
MAVGLLIWLPVGLLVGEPKADSIPMGWIAFSFVLVGAVALGYVAKAWLAGDRF